MQKKKERERETIIGARPDGTSLLRPALRQEDRTFLASLGYIGRPCLKQLPFPPEIKKAICDGWHGCPPRTGNGSDTGDTEVSKILILVS